MEWNTRRRGRGLVLTLAAAFATALAGVPVSPAAAAAPRTTLPDDVLRGLGHARELGSYTGTVSIGVSIARRDPAGLAQLLHDEYTPGTAAYHHFLTPQQFNARFAPAQAHLQAVEAWLRAGGATVTSVPGATDYLLASGSASRMGALLAVRFDRFTFQGTTFYANTTAPSVPSDLGVDAVSGLNSLEGPRLEQHGHTARPSAPAHRPAAPDPSMNTGLSTPPVLWNVYDQPSDNMGQGQQIAVFGWGTTNNTQSDLRQFETEYQLPAVPFSVGYYGTETKVTDSGGEPEWDIDTQASTGMAPDATALKLYFGKAGTDPDLIAAYKAWVDDPNGPLQGNSSFSGCEEAPGTDSFTGGPGSPSGYLIFGNPNQDQYTAQLQQAVAEGRTMFASAGDTGSGCPAIALELNGATLVPTPMMGFPAVSPYAVGVGGTVLYFDGDGSAKSPAKRAFEYGWDYTGGGTSLFLAAGAYQNVSPPILLMDCVADNHGTPYTTPTPCRGIPDIAAESGDITGNGYTVTMGGSNDQQGAGTSLSSPLWTGMWARIQAAAASAGGNGFADPALYKAAIGANSAADFFDIGGASADTAPTCNGPNPVYNCSRPGWDYVSGWGAPDVTNLMKDIDGGTTPSNPTTPNPPPPAPTSSGPVTASNGGTTCPGPQIVDATGDAADGYPGGGGQNMDNLDIVNVAFASPSATTLQVTMAVKDLEPVVGTDQETFPSALWQVLWTYNGAQYNVTATVDGAGPAAQWSFFDGTGSAAANAITGTATTGPYTGTGAAGTLVWNVPVSDVGNPGSGADLHQTFATTHGSLTVGGTGLYYTAAADRAPDKGFGADWLAGTTCPGAPGAVLPEAPAAAGLLTTGAGVAVIAMLAVSRRRRRLSRTS